MEVKDVKIFPTAYRSASAEGKYMSESNFANIINSVVDYPANQDGYVISYENRTLVVVIDGHLISIDSVDISGAKFVSIVEEEKTGCLVSLTGLIDSLDINNTCNCVAIGDNPLSPPKQGCIVKSVQVSKEGKIINTYKVKAANVEYKAGESVESSLNGKQDKLKITSQINSSSTDDQFATAKTIYDALSNGTVSKLGSANVGSNTKFMYLSSGSPVASSLTLGSTNQLIYLNNGEFKSGIQFIAGTTPPEQNPNASGAPVGSFYFQYNG